MADSTRPEALDLALAGWFAQLTHQGIFTTDAHVRIVMWNRWMETHSGLAAEAMVGRPVFELFPDVVARGVDQYYRDALRGQISVVSYGLHRYVLQLPPTHPDLDLPYMPQSARIAPLWDAGTVIGTVTLLDDVSDRLGSEIELRKQIQAQRVARETAEQALRAKDEFLSTLSHELRQPLNAVLGWTRILRDQRTMDADLLARALRVIDKNAMLQTRMIEDLLDMARIVSGKLRLEMQPVDMAVVAAAAVDVVTPAALSKGLTIETQFAPAVPQVLGDAARLQQVVSNLLSNAVKFTDTGGRISVRVETYGRQVRVTVTDTGRGISHELLPFIFEPFRQGDASSSRRESGLGLGLALVRDLVQLHGGRVTAANTGQSHGAVFTVDLPSESAPARPRWEAQADPGTASRPDLTGVRVLVVDDDADARELMLATLADCGATVLTASSGAEALTLVVQSSSEVRPHVIVSDIGMPDEDGYAFIRQLRSLAPERGGRTPAVALTAYADVEDRERALSAGYQAHVSKPSAPIALSTAVTAVLRADV